MAIVLEFFRNLLRREAAVFFMGALPISELRGAIPFGLSLGLPPLEVFLLAVAGNLLPVPFILLLLDPVFRLVQKWPLIGPLLHWVYARTHRRSRWVVSYGALALILFTAVPLPTTGAWTASVAAVLFNIDRRRALGAIAVGVFVAGLVVMALSQGLILALPHFGG